jgi:hypothetical protein
MAIKDTMRAPNTAMKSMSESELVIGLVTKIAPIVQDQRKTITAFGTLTDMVWSKGRVGKLLEVGMQVVERAAKDVKAGR